MERSISFAFFSLLLFFNNLCFFFQARASETTAPSANGSLKFKLIHRHSPEFGDQNPGSTIGTPRSQKERMQQLVHSDHARVHIITQRRLAAAGGSSRRSNLEVSKIWATFRNNLVQLPVRSAADLGKGQYFVSIRVGTPPRKFILIVDTGSSLTWMKCKYECETCNSTFRAQLQERVFDARKSLTFKPIPCSEDICKEDLKRLFALAECPSPMAPCAYKSGYLDGTQVRGIFANETVKVRLSGGQKIKVNDVLIGCTELIEGSFHEIDGILGLGFDTYSFAVKGAQQFGDKFSYCLVDHMSPSNLVNFLVFGEVGNTPLPNMQYTQLIIDPMSQFYGVNVSGISVDGKMLDIPSYFWDIAKGGGTIMDTGSSLMFLFKPALDKLVEAFQPSLSRFTKVELDLGTITPSYCFNDAGYEESLMPKLEIHFVDGAKLTPPVKSYVIPAAPNVSCLGFVATAFPGISIIGNILQQNHLWEFDLKNRRLGFASSSCTFD